MKPIHNFLFSVFVAASVIAFPVSSQAAETPESLDKIIETATAKKTPILLLFTGSDWCPPCMRMEKEVFNTPEFENYAKADIAFVKLDFPRRSAQSEEIKTRNEALAQKFGITGFPTMVLLSSSGKELAKQVGGVSGGASAVMSWVKKSTAK